MKHIPKHYLTFLNPVILDYLMKNKLIDGNILTVTGKTLGENCERWVHKHGELSFTSQDVIRPLSKPIKSTGHLRYKPHNYLNLQFVDDRFTGFSRVTWHPGEPSPKSLEKKALSLLARPAPSIQKMRSSRLLKLGLSRRGRRPLLCSDTLDPRVDPVCLRC